MRKLVATAVCLLSLSLSVTTGRRCIKCCEQQLRRVDKALSRAGDIAVGSWICLSHRNLILAEDKRLCGERLYAVFNEMGKMSVTEYKSGKNCVTIAASSQIKNSRPTSCSLPGSQKKMTSENKEKHTK